MEHSEEIYKTAEGDAYCWCEQGGSIMIKAVTKFGDPVELTKEEAIGLANALLKQAEIIE